MEAASNTDPLGSMNKNTPLQLLAEGKDQVINVDHKRMFNKITAALGARSPPLFSEIDCGLEGVKVCIQLDLSFVEANSVAVVEGEPFMKKSAAKKSAVSVAFRHLDENCHIRVLDFSSRVARSFGFYNTYGHVNEAMDSVVKVIGKFENTLDKCKEFAHELEGKEVKQKLSGNLSGDGLVYAGISEFVVTVVEASSEKVSVAKSKMNAIEFDRMKHHKRGTEKSKAVLNKCYVKNVVLPAKDLLHYVLSYFSFANAKYSNGPDGHGMVKAVAKFRVPNIESLKFCGKLEIEGRGTSSHDAEEDAAFKALLFIEENFSVKIIDLNHSDRVEAEEVQVMLLTLVDRILEVGEDVKGIWGKMANAIEEQHDDFSNEVLSLANAAMPRDQTLAKKFCADGLAEVLQHSAICYDACSALFDQLSKITCKLSVIKIKLNII